MAVIRWEALGELSTVQSEMNRLFDTFFEGGTPVNGGARRWIPAMDLLETDDELVLRADLPGMSQSDVNIELEGNVLTVSGERKLEHEANDGAITVWSARRGRLRARSRCPRELTPRA